MVLTSSWDPICLYLLIEACLVDGRNVGKWYKQFFSKFVPDFGIEFARMRGPSNLPLIFLRAKDRVVSTTF